MRKISLELEGVTVTARLLDDKAPKTCQALWDILPFQDMVTHSHWASARFHTTHHPKLDIDGSRYPLIENPSSFQAPGDVVIWPVTNEIMTCYAPGRFSWMGQPWLVTKVATIPGDMGQFARKIERIQWEGAKRVIIRRAREDEDLKPLVVGSGAKIVIECEGKRWVAELFDDRAPKLCQAILNNLPLEGPITNMHGSGEIFHYWAPIHGTPKEIETKRERPPVDYQGKQIGSSAIAYFDPRELRGTNPGDIIFDSVEGLRFVHGQIQNDQSQFGGSSRGQKIARIIEGDLEELDAISKRIDWEGAKTLRVTKL